MDLTLNEEQKMVQETARRFAENEVAPIAAEMDARGEVPFAAIRKMAQLGFLGLTVPEEYDGGGADTVSYVLALEEISKACASTAVVMAVQNSLFNYPLSVFGTEEQKERFLRPAARGEKIGAFALTEPEAGSDAAAQKTTAVRDGDVYIINGTKHFITNGPFADLVLLFAMTDKSQGHRGITAFIVEKGTPGFSVGKVEHKMGIRASATSELIFEDCRVPAANRLGQEGEGFKIAMVALDAGRIGIGAQAVGISRAAYETALRYAQERKQFGQPIARFQAIQWMLADMITRIEASHLLTIQAALKHDAGERHTLESSMCKLFASETASFVTDCAIQILGGYGYMQEYPVERYYRDARITRIYEGTNEIQRLVIANQILR
ncbi:MAG: acyl-CoA dehydrogenase [Anaerolineae bacterium]